MYFYFCGIICILAGIVLVFDSSAPVAIGGIPQGGDIGDLKWVLSPILILFGLMIIYREYKKYIRGYIIEFSKCPECKEIFTYSKLKDGKCKNCKYVDTVDLAVYFEQFPEEKKEKKRKKKKIKVPKDKKILGQL